MSQFCPGNLSIKASLLTHYQPLLSDTDRDGIVVRPDIGFFQNRNKLFDLTVF